MSVPQAEIRTAGVIIAVNTARAEENASIGFRRVRLFITVAARALQAEGTHSARLVEYLGAKLKKLFAR